jgi:excisionase family DNA binding protein
MKVKPINAWPALMSVEAAAQYIGLGRDKVYDLMNAGEIGKHKEGARTLIRRSDLDEWVERKFPASRQSGQPTIASSGNARPNNPPGDMPA